MEAPDRTNLLSPEVCGPGPTPCSLPNTLVGDAPLLHLITRKLLEDRGGTSFTLAPPKSSPMPSLQLASVRLYKLAVAGSFPLYAWMAINPSNHSTLYTANAQGCKAHTRNNTVFPLLSRLTSLLVFKILLKACPWQDVSLPWRGRDEGRETYQDLSWRCTEFSQQPWESRTRVIPVLQLRKLRLREVRHPVIEPIRAGCLPVPHWAMTQPAP